MEIYRTHNVLLHLPQAAQEDLQHHQDQNHSNVLQDVQSVVKKVSMQKTMLTPVQHAQRTLLYKVGFAFIITIANLLTKEESVQLVRMDIT